MREFIESDFILLFDEEIAEQKRRMFAYEYPGIRIVMGRPLKNSPECLAETVDLNPIYPHNF